MNGDENEMEAAIGFEPMNEGFADLCLSHLATPPLTLLSSEFYEMEVRSGRKNTS